LTTDEFFLSLYEAGCTRREILRSELSHLLMRLRAYKRRMRREEVHVLGQRNEVRSAFGGDPVDPYQMERAPSTGKSGDLDAFKWRVQQETEIDIERDLTNN